MHIFMYLLLAAATAFAHGVRSPREKCEGQLGLTVESIGERGEDMRWTLEAGVGPRGLKTSSWPPFDGPSDRNAMKQTVFMWHHYVTVARSIEEARAHDAKLIPYKQMMYIITDRSLDDLLPTTDLPPGFPAEERAARLARAELRAKELLQARDVKVVWFPNPTPHEGDFANGRFSKMPTHIGRDIEEFGPNIVGAFLHPEEMGIVRDDLGTRFIQHGWFLPPYRGVMTLEETFRPKASGKTPESGSVKKAYDLLLRFVAAGWTIRINHDFDEVIELEKRTIHNLMGQAADGGEPAFNSRYLEAHVEKMAREAFATGHGFTFELRDPAGHLYGASLGFIGSDRLISFDTIAGMGAPRPAGPDKDNSKDGRVDAINLRKAIIAGGLVWSTLEMGFPFADQQVVSATTGQLKCFLEPARSILAKVSHGPPARGGCPSGIWTPPPYDVIFRAIDESAHH